MLHYCVQALARPGRHTAGRHTALLVGRWWGPGVQMVQIRRADFAPRALMVAVADAFGPSEQDVGSAADFTCAYLADNDRPMRTVPQARRALRSCDAALRSYTRRQKMPGTAVALAGLNGTARGLTWWTFGNARLYRLGPNGLEQINRARARIDPHPLPDCALGAPQRRWTRAQAGREQPRPGWRYLLATGGLHGLTRTRLVQILRTRGDDACRELLSAAAPHTEAALGAAIIDVLDTRAKDWRNERPKTIDRLLMPVAARHNEEAFTTSVSYVLQDAEGRRYHWKYWGNYPLELGQAYRVRAAVASVSGRGIRITRGRASAMAKAG